ncbi:MAG: hypothetical protein ACOC2U_02105 [bacterium]
MTFLNFIEKTQNQFEQMCKTGKLFKANVSGDEVWKTYINSFEKNDDPVFRDPSSTTHTCNLCKNFIRRYGNIVAIVNNELTSIFDVDVDKPYKKVAKNLSKKIKSAKISDVFFETYNELNSLPYESCNKNQDFYKLGLAYNHKMYTAEEAEMYGVVAPDEVRTFNHFNLDLPTRFVDKSNKSIERIKATYRDKYSVFKRAMEEISLDTLYLVKDLIKQGSLLDGNSHLYPVEKYIEFKDKYNNTQLDKDIFCWLETYDLDNSLAKFKNTLIGVLCTELSEGEEINKACKNWNIRVDPVNYHKATAPITQKQINEARKFVEENGYEKSFDRRFATIDDIKASEIKHINSGDGNLKSVSIFDDVKPTTSRHKRNEFKNVEEINIDKFMKDILPSCSSVELFLTNKMANNLVALTTSKHENSKPIFKWDNNYSWTFNGNLAGKSQIKDAVESHGGNIKGVLRFSIMWSEDNNDNSDLDAHCKEPTKHIYYAQKKAPSGGELDIDITDPERFRKSGYKTVENIFYPSTDKMKDGKYLFFVHNFRDDHSQGFKAEIEVDGEIYQYEYEKSLNHNENVKVAEVTLDNGEFHVKHFLPEKNQSKEIWNLETNQFHKVNLICNSPNHWNDNSVGNLHYMFMLEGCKPDTELRTFHNENLKPELLEHRKVMEVLGATNKIEPTDKQLSGVGFNSTIRDEVIVKCSGNFKRMLKIKF